MIKVRPPWWIEHRQRRAHSNRPKKLNTEMIFRKSFKQTLKEYVDNGSLAGVKQMCDPQIGFLRRLVWITVLLTALGVVSYFFFYIWSDILSKPLIVTMETLTYPISKVNFPGVAICNVNRISKKAMSEFAREIHRKVAKKRTFFEKEYPIELVESFVLQYGQLIDFTYNQSTQNHPIFKSMVELYRDDSSKVNDIMKRLAPKCEEMLLKCSWAGKLVECWRIFKARRTGLGHCCTFNFILDHIDGLPTKIPEAIKRQNEPGHYYGLNVILDPLTEDYAYPIKHAQGFQVSLFPPSTFPDSRSGRVVNTMIEPGKGSFLEVTAVLQVSTNEVRKYSHDTRGCYFKDENKAKYNNMYSYSSCIEYCRAETLYSLCKCVPYYIAKFGPSPDVNVCTIDDLRCLNKYKEKLLYLYPSKPTTKQGLEVEIQESLYCPDCLPNCEVIRYYAKAHKISMTTAGFRHKEFNNIFIKGFNMTNKSCLSIYSAVPDAALNRLDVVNYWFEILSNIGGFCGIVMGLSFVSAFELLFFIFIRFPHLFYENFKKYH